MSGFHNLAVTMTHRERLFGWLYLLTELFLLPLVLQSINAWLPTPLADHWLNFLYFLINFLS